MLRPEIFFESSQGRRFRFQNALGFPFDYECRGLILFPNHRIFCETSVATDAKLRTLPNDYGVTVFTPGCRYCGTDYSVVPVLVGVFNPQTPDNFKRFVRPSSIDRQRERRFGHRVLRTWPYAP